jgi:hypothetical protein
MRLLTVSDKVEPVLYGPYIRERVGNIDLVLACGDIPYYYLEYIVGLLDAPLYYVHGNHDKRSPVRPYWRTLGDARLRVGRQQHAPGHLLGLLLAGFEAADVQPRRAVSVFRKRAGRYS